MICLRGDLRELYLTLISNSPSGKSLIVLSFTEIENNLSMPCSIVIALNFMLGQVLYRLLVQDLLVTILPMLSQLVDRMEMPRELVTTPSRGVEMAVTLPLP